MGRMKDLYIDQMNKEMEEKHMTGTWIYVGKKEVECPHCKKDVMIEIRLRSKK